MPEDRLIDLSECTEFRRSLAACAPQVLHWTAILLVTLFGAALIWAWATPADLVVRASGHIRPLTEPRRISAPPNTPSALVSSAGRVVSVSAHEGDLVSPGDVLVSVDTGPVEIELKKAWQAVQAAEQQLSALHKLEAWAAQESDEALAKTEAEMRDAIVKKNKEETATAVDMRLAELDLESIRADYLRIHELAASGITSRAELERSTIRLRQAEAKAAAFHASLDDSRIDVLRRALAASRNAFAARKTELQIRRETVEAQLIAAKLDLSTLEQRRNQASIRAPIGGVIIAENIRPGDVLEPGTSILEIADEARFRFDIAVSAEDVASVHTGMPARVRLDAYDQEQYSAIRGTVSFVAPDVASTESRGQPISSGYVVRIEMSTGQMNRSPYVGRTRLGMTGRAEIVTGRDRLLSLLFRQLRSRLSFG